MTCWYRTGFYLLLFGGGALSSMAFAPVNQPLAMLLSLAMLFGGCRNASAWKAALGGWCWGAGYALFSFFWLSDIHGIIPFALMPVLGFYYVPVGWAAAILNRWLLLPESVRIQGFTAQIKFRDLSAWRQLSWCAGVAAMMVVVEYLRHSVLPWNYVGSIFWNNVVMLQLVRVTGVYGLTFLWSFTAAALALASLTAVKRLPETNRLQYRRPWPLITALLLLVLAMMTGVWSLKARTKEYLNYSITRIFTFVQGNISQRRNSDDAGASEALEQYRKLTETQLGKRTDLIIWPETAVPYPLRGSNPVSARYRQTVQMLSEQFSAPLLVGTLEYDLTQKPYGLFNSAVLLDNRDILQDGYRGMYSKVHPVPFGEFIPLRSILPKWIARQIDMNRDLTAGISLAPLALDEKVQLGVQICFEDVFPYIARGEWQRGANLLVVITNDAWYPNTSEPEQHLANAVIRAVETNLPMVRCGNDSASSLILPDGRILWHMANAQDPDCHDPAFRTAGAATIPVNLPDENERTETFYVRFGDWFVGVCAILLALELAAAWIRRLKWAKETALIA